jgi:hypothetical protein
MPCFTKIQLVTLNNDRFTLAARKKLGLSLKGDVTEEQATEVRIEAAKLKTAEAIKLMNPGAQIKGMQAGNNKLEIDLDI